MHWRRYAPWLVFLCALCLSGCVHNHEAINNGDAALNKQQWDVAVAEYSRALALDPGNAELKLKFDMAKTHASREHYDKAKRFLAAHNMQETVAELEIATQLDPGNTAAIDLLNSVKSQIEHTQTQTAPVEEDRPLSQLPTVALQPEFKPNSSVPIELKFKDTSLKEVLQTLGKVGDVNLLFDKDFNDLPVSFDFTNTTFLQALDTVLTSTHNFYKVIGKNTIMIAPDNPQKRSEYEETVSRTFFLSNADVEEIARVLRNVLGIQMIATDVRLNAVTVKDHITRIMAAEKLVRQLDKAKPEVVVDVEILEVNRSRFNQYGLQIASPGSEGPAPVLTTQPQNLALDASPFLTKSNFFITNFPQATFRLLKQDSDTKLLASLPLRSVVGETGRVRFGNQVPVPQTTFAPIATGGVNQQPITSFIYRDVGINIDITPRVHMDGDVTMEVIIESSSIAGQGFANLPQFSTSRVEKTIRLKEGETNIIAGLIRDEERQSMRGLPLLASVPFVGKFFAANEKEITETDVVLALSPHIVRSLSIGADDEKMLWLGIEEQQGGAGIYR
ncbi:MAG TPA: secretin N-terminal domain-containing protein, partial [Acidobacteriota bacterium]|nr:secretin N-terminal domain-containing protein [Acidobacteriota bacterium]